MERLINYDDVRAQFQKRLDASNPGMLSEAYYSACIEILDEAPAVDAVEVVRCRECVHIRPIVDMETGEEISAYWCELLELEFCELDDYYSMGQRREDGDGGWLLKFVPATSRRRESLSGYIIATTNRR